MTTPPPRRRHRGRVLLGALAATLIVIPLSVAPATALERDGVLVGEMTPELRARIQTKLESYRHDNTIAGLSVAVVTPQRGSDEPVVTQFQLGATTFDSSAPVITPTQQFELGSETKAFTADLLALLLAEGRISLDDTVGQYAPPGIDVWQYQADPSSPLVPITIGQLATHQSGLPDLPDPFYRLCDVSPPPCENDNPRPIYSQQEMWASVDTTQTPDSPFLWQPGTQWFYSNWGFALLGVILANIVDDAPIDERPRYQEALDGAFLDDLGMNETALEWPEAEVAQPFLRPAQQGQPGATAGRWNNDNAFAGGGGLISDAIDMSRWVAAHLGYGTADKPLGVRSLANTLNQVGTVTSECRTIPETTEITCRAPQFQSGLAWQLYPVGWGGVGVPHAWKNGGTLGSASDTALAPTARVGVTAMFNQYSDGSTSIATQVLAEIIPLERPRPPILPETGVDGLAVTLLAAGGLLVAGVGLLALRRSRRDHGRPHSTSVTPW